MRLADAVTLQGTVRIVVRSAITGRVVSRQRVRNLVVLVGRNQVRDAIYGDVITAPTHMAFGTGGDPAAAGDTTLQAEVWRAVFSTRTKASSAVTFRYFLTSTTANGSTLREAGLLNAASSGDLFGRVLYSPIEKTALVTVLFVWTITMGTA